MIRESYSKRTGSFTLQSCFGKLCSSCKQEIILNSLYFFKKFISECSLKTELRTFCMPIQMTCYWTAPPAPWVLSFVWLVQYAGILWNKLKQIRAMKKSYLPAFCLGSQYLEGKAYFAWLFPSIAPVALGLVIGRRSGWEVWWDKTPFLVIRNQKGKDRVGRWFSDEKLSAKARGQEFKPLKLTWKLGNVYTPTARALRGAH